MDTLPSGDLLLRPTTLLNAVSWIWRPSFERQRDFNPPEQRAAQRTLRASPPPHPTRSISHELPVDPDSDHRWGFPCCVWSPLPTCHRHCPGRSDGASSLSVSIVSGLPCEKVRSAPAIIVSGPAQRSLVLWPACSPSRHATLYIEGFDSLVASAAASIATGWNEPVPGRELHPLKSSAFHGALFRQLTSARS